MDIVDMALAAWQDDRLSDGDLYKKLADEITSLRNQLAEYQKDAERYRFIRDNPDLQIEFTGELTLDEYVDKAMSEKG